MLFKHKGFNIIGKIVNVVCFVSSNRFNYDGGYAMSIKRIFIKRALSLFLVAELFAALTCFNAYAAVPIKTDEFETAWQACESMKMGKNLSPLGWCQRGDPNDNETNPGNRSFKYIDILEFEGQRSYGSPEIDVFSNYDLNVANYNVIERSLIGEIADAGFDVIRLWVTWYPHMDKKGNIDEIWLDRVQEVVDYILDEGMYCIIDVHDDSSAGVGNGWIAASDESYAKAKGRFENMWRGIAERFKSYDEKLLFEAFNEISFDSEQPGISFLDLSYEERAEAQRNITEYMQLFVDTVRSTGGGNSQRNLVVEPYWATMYHFDNVLESELPELESFVLPEDTIKDHLIVQVHAYFWPWIPDENGGHREYWGTNEDKAFAADIVDLMKHYSRKLNVPFMNGETGTDKYDEKVMAEYAAYCSALHAEAGIPYVWCPQIFNTRTNEEFYPLVLDEISKGTHFGRLHAPNAKAQTDKNTVTLLWREINAADGYNVYKYNSKTQKYELIEFTKKCSISFSGLSNGTYRYKLSTLCTYNGKKTEGELSDTITAKITGKPAADAGFEQAAQAAANMGAGYSLNNSFDYKGTDLKYNAANSYFETSLGQPITTKEHIALIKDAGFDTLRIPIEWLSHCSGKGAVNSKWLNRIKQIVDWALAEDMYVIINMQSGISENYRSAKLMATRASYEQYSDTVRKIWTTISEQFKDYNDKLIFGGISELITFDQGGYGWRNDDGGVSGYWINKWNRLFVDTVRQLGGNNQYRNLCISTYSSALFNTSMAPLYLTFLNDVEVPDDIYDGHILLDVHYTSQRLGDKWGSKADKKAVDEIISLLNEYSARLGVPIIMGEFAVTGGDETNYYTNNDAVKEYLGYWAQSAARIGVPIVYSHYYGSLVDRWNMKLWDGERAIANTLTVNANLGKLAAPAVEAAVNGRKVTLKWEAVAGAYGYKIYEYNNATKKYEQNSFIKTTGKTFKTLSKGTHKYKIVTVSKFNGKNTSGNYSDVITVKIK